MCSATVSGVAGSSVDSVRAAVAEGAEAAKAGPECSRDVVLSFLVLAPVAAAPLRNCAGVSPLEVVGVLPFVS